MTEHRNSNGTYNGAAVLGELSGLGQAEVLRLWDAVKDNQKRLDSCKAHNFEPVLPLQTMRQKYRCSCCEGVIDSSAHHWYALGLKHGELSR